jgi:hypothetical protein
MRLLCVVDFEWGVLVFCASRAFLLHIDRCCFSVASSPGEICMDDFMHE